MNPLGPHCELVSFMAVSARSSSLCAVFLERSEAILVKCVQNVEKNFTEKRLTLHHACFVLLNHLANFHCHRQTGIYNSCAASTSESEEFDNLLTPVFYASVLLLTDEFRHNIALRTGSSSEEGEKMFGERETEE